MSDKRVTDKFITTTIFDHTRILDFWLSCVCVCSFLSSVIFKSSQKQPLTKNSRDITKYVGHEIDDETYWTTPNQSDPKPTHRIRNTEKIIICILNEWCGRRSYGWSHKRARASAYTACVSLYCVIWCTVCDVDIVALPPVHISL